MFSGVIVAGWVVDEEFDSGAFADATDSDAADSPVTVCCVCGAIFASALAGRSNSS